MKLTYHQEGDYLIPDLEAPDSPQIGIWGERRRQYLRKHRKPIYSGMLMSGSLNAHLEEVDRAAEKMIEQLTAEMAKRDGVTETLKAENQMAWVQQMNSIRNRIEEVIYEELIFT